MRKHGRKLFARKLFARKLFARKLFAVVISVSILAGVAGCGDVNSPTAPSNLEFDAATGCLVASNTVLGYTNYERCLRGLAPLSANSLLDAVAQCHTDDMVNRGYVSHIALEPAPCGGATPDRRITAAGYRWDTFGENIAYGYSEPRAIVAAWMTSPGHRDNLVNPDFTEMGIGRNGNTWTQVLGRQ